MWVLQPHPRVVVLCFFFFNDTATTEIYTPSLHDALPICKTAGWSANDGAPLSHQRPHSHHLRGARNSSRRGNRNRHDRPRRRTSLGSPPRPLRHRPARRPPRHSPLPARTSRNLRPRPPASPPHRKIHPRARLRPSLTRHQFVPPSRVFWAKSAESLENKRVDFSVNNEDRFRLETRLGTGTRLKKGGEKTNGEELNTPWGRLPFPLRRYPPSRWRPMGSRPGSSRRGPC